MRVLGSGHRGLHHHLFSTRTGDDDERQIDALGAIDPKIKSCAALRESQDLKGEDSLPAAGVVSWFTDFCGSGLFPESSSYYEDMLSPTDSVQHFSGRRLMPPNALSRPNLPGGPKVTRATESQEDRKSVV